MKHLLPLIILFFAFTVSSYSQNNCTYGMDPINQDVGTAGGNFTIAITAQNGCAWTVFTAPNATWVTINSSSSGSGNGTVSYTVQPNTGDQRSGTISVAGRAFFVFQASPCSISPTEQTFANSGGSGTVNVTSASLCNWTARANSPWITVTNGASGSGNGTVIFTVAPNAGPARTGEVSVAGQSITIIQSGGFCSYSLSSTSYNSSSSSESGTVSVTTQPGCTWSALSNVLWITTFTNSNGTVTFSVEANTGPARTGTITIAGQTFTVTQASGCTYSLDRNNVFYPNEGGNTGINVTTNPGCTWTATTNAAWINITVATGTGNGAVEFSFAANTGPIRSGTININGQVYNFSQQAGSASRRTIFDFDGDGKADFSIYRPDKGEWWYQRSSDGGNRAFQFGASTDKIVPADYTGDGKTDIAIFRPSTGEWFILRSEDNSYYAFPFGANGDIPAPADYDGDKKADAAVYRPSTLTWYILQSSAGIRIEQHGGPGELPIPADYNGDGRADLRTAFNGIGAKWVAADYTGDGKADMASYNPLSGIWVIQRSDDAIFYQVKFGIGGDIAVPADYDGDGKTDIAIWRPSTTDWWYMASSANGEARTVRFGVSSDIPVPSAYVR